MKKLLPFLLTLIAGANTWAAKPVLANIDLAKAVGSPVVKERADLGVALIFATDAELEKLSELAHERGYCGGYELVPNVVAESQGSMMILSTKQIDELFASVEKSQRKSVRVSNFMKRRRQQQVLDFDPNIDAAVQAVDANQLLEGVAWLQGFGGRYHASRNPNVHVDALAEYLNQLGAESGLAYEVHLVEHRNTRQNSVMFRLPGYDRPDETIVLGGHLDSINHQVFGDKNNAPGADDNASGSASLIEALKVILSTAQQPQRTLEFMWYAAEEVGLVGSGEIADQYARDGRDVVAVLQLDMTLFPGSGEFTIASMTDFTSPWLRGLLEQINEHYIHARIVHSQCGYGCSDHASWDRRGYPTLFPFEARFNDMNRRIHTPDDVISERVSADHSAKFAQIAVAFGLLLGNSELREPAVLF